MSLSDGRSLAYTELGAPSSPVLMYFHGAPTSRLDLAVLGDAFAGLDVRVVGLTDRVTAGRLLNRAAVWRIGRRMWLPWPIT